MTKTEVWNALQRKINGSWEAYKAELRQLPADEIKKQNRSPAERVRF